MAYPGAQQQNVVIVAQPSTQHVGQPQNIKGWSTWICGCIDDFSWACEDDCLSCCYACWCYPCFLCTLAGNMDEFLCGPHCCGIMFLVAMRTKMRAKHGIGGSICEDICCMCCCQFCATTQLHRELKHLEHV